MKTKRFLKVLSRHPSHNILRKKNGGVLLDCLAVIRLGSTTKHKAKIQINSIDAVLNSSNKLRMKKCFDEFSVNTAQWWPSLDTVLQKGIEQVPFPIIAKPIYGSRGNGLILIRNQYQLDKIIRTPLRGYIYEKFYDYTREYRLHVTKYGCFYTCRKLIKEDTPEEERWYRNNNNCVWILEENTELFNKPKSWKEIEQECIKALISVGLDVGACDVKVTKTGQFKILEINSAPSFGDITAEKYRNIIPILVEEKKKKLNLV